MARITAADTAAPAARDAAAGIDQSNVPIHEAPPCFRSISLSIHAVLLVAWLVFFREHDGDDRLALVPRADHGLEAHAPPALRFPILHDELKQHGVGGLAA